VSAGRLEVRHFDAAINPYHSIAACVMASLDGIRRALDPGPPCSENVMRDLHTRPELQIPLTLADAMRSFEADDLMREVFPPNLHRAMLQARADEWHRFWAEVSDWEREFYLRRWP
jgi:glutamine synthetase